MGAESDLVILIDNNTPDNQFVREILSRAQMFRVPVIKGPYNLETNKKIAYLSDQKGFIRPCPCSRRYRCCNYFTIDTIEGCIYECDYCILKSFLDRSKILVKVDVKTLLQELKDLDEQLLKKGIRIRIGTGELGDSLALDHLFPFAPLLIEELKDSKNLILELKTKSDNVEGILNIDHNPSTTISFSMSSEPLHRMLEDTPPPHKRIEAAIRCVNNSYKVGFHFDPIIYYDGYENDYGEIIKKIKTSIPVEAISWISLGTIRFSPAMIDHFRSKILFGEYILDAEKKFRYPITIRKRIYRTISDMIRDTFSDKIRIYCCMELDSMSEIVNKRRFATDEEMNRFIIGDSE